MRTPHMSPKWEGKRRRQGSSVMGPCSICLDTVWFGAQRSTATLRCGHRFHLDCIGSAFNARGTMQCPTCRNIEDGDWHYANGKSNDSPSVPDTNLGISYHRNDIPAVMEFTTIPQLSEDYPKEFTFFFSFPGVPTGHRFFSFTLPWRRLCLLILSLLLYMLVFFCTIPVRYLWRLVRFIGRPLGYSRFSYSV